MDGTKCSHCSLINLESDYACRRCGHQIGDTTWTPSVSPRDRARHSSRLYPLLALTIVGAAIYYVYTGAEASIENVQTATAGTPVNTTRRVAEQKQANAYKTAVQNSNGLSQSQKHNDDIQKLSQPGR